MTYIYYIVKNRGDRGVITVCPQGGDPVPNFTAKLLQIAKSNLQIPAMPLELGSCLGYTSILLQLSLPNWINNYYFLEWFYPLKYLKWREPILGYKKVWIGDKSLTNTFFKK